jgi:DNA-binding CsgD family transcriptional regulator
MSVLPSTSVFIAGPEPSLRDELTAFLSLDPEATVGSAATALEGFNELPIASLVEMTRGIGRPSAPRHLVPVPGHTRDMRSVLSDRELQVVRLLAEGISNKEISLRMKLSDKTVKNHISHILAKMQLTARTQVAVHALRTGLV